MILYTKAHCPKCEDIKAKLTKGNVTFEVKQSEDCMPELIEKLKKAELKSPILPVIEFDDGTLISNNMGLYKALKEREIL